MDFTNPYRMRMVMTGRDKCIEYVCNCERKLNFDIKLTTSKLSSMENPFTLIFFVD